MTLLAVGQPWLAGIDLHEHHGVDLDDEVERGVSVAIVRAGRGTRQDARWFEHVRAAWLGGLHVGSYWQLSPSHTDAYRQAELWMAAIRSVPWPFECGHWADITATDGFEPSQFARYTAAFLRRMDELLGERVGVFSTDEFRRDHPALDDPDRPRWACADGMPIERAWADRADSFGVRTQPARPDAPGRHAVDATHLWGAVTTRVRHLRLVVRHADESAEEWRERWIEAVDVALLQQQLNRNGADVVVDGVYGPETDAAVSVDDLLRRRDRLAAAAGDDDVTGRPREPARLCRR